MKSNMRLKLLAALAFVLSATQITFVSCSDDPSSENYYTSTSDYASSYLMRREQFSEFVKILDRAKLTNLLNTYGSYTVFAPTNDAINEFLAAKGWASVEEMTDSACQDLAYNHIIESAAYFTTDHSVGTYPIQNMHKLDLSITMDTAFVNGEIEIQTYINKTARMIHMDDSVDNGVVHTMRNVIGTQTDKLADVIAKDSSLSLFYEALVLTGLADTLTNTPLRDVTYTIGLDSINWDNLDLVKHTAVEYDNVAYPKERLFKFTAFVEKNEVYEKYGVTNIEQLKELAAEIYDPVYPEDRNITDPTDRRNSLNRFIAYHLLDRHGSYYTLTIVDGPNSEIASYFNRRKWDVADWYETMMPHSILKCSFPTGSQNGLWINRRGVQARADYRGGQVRGAKLAKPDEYTLDQSATNGIYHYIDDIICYGINQRSPYPSNNVNFQEEVLTGERLRFDCSTLSPDFMTQQARGCTTRNGKYGIGDASKSIANKNTCYGFKAGFAKNFTFKDNQTHIHVRPRVLNFWSYQGDEVTIKGKYDLTVKLPPVPEGDWELRMMTCVDFQSRGIVQFYIDGVPQGIPFDMRPGGRDTRIGWQEETNDEEQNAAFDKQFHYRGWMKGPKCYNPGGGGSSMRELANTIRRVIGTFHSDGKEDHYLRLQQKLDSEENECNFDFIELCPSQVYNNPDLAEDPW